MDDSIGRILDKLASQGLLDETIILITSDHGENQGELNVYGDHQTADHITGRVPMIIRWPGVTSPASVDSGLHYQIDLLPTLAEMLKVKPSDRWDGQSYASALRRPGSASREALVLSQLTWSCQRAVRWDKWIMIRTYHAGLKDYPPVMLFDVAADPHEEHDLAAEQPQIVAIGLALLEEWHAEQMAGSPSPIDPMQTVLREGGPYHTRASLTSYVAQSALDRPGRRRRSARRGIRPDELEVSPLAVLQSRQGCHTWPWRCRGRVCGAAPHPARSRGRGVHPFDVSTPDSRFLFS